MKRGLYITENGITEKYIHLWFINKEYDLFVLIIDRKYQIYNFSKVLNQKMKNQNLHNPFSFICEEEDKLFKMLDTNLEFFIKYVTKRYGKQLHSV